MKFEDIMTDRPIVTLGLAGLTLLTTVGVNLVSKKIKKQEEDDDDVLTIDNNFLEYMRAGKLDIKQLANMYDGRVEVDPQFVEDIKAGKIIITEEDKKQLSPLVTFQPVQIQQPVQQVAVPQPAYQNPVQPMQPVQPVQPIQPIQTAQTVQFPQQPVQPIINGQVAPVNN